MNAKEVFIAAQPGLKAMKEIAYAYFQRSYEEISFFSEVYGLTFRRGLVVRLPEQSATAAQRDD